jgi:hypothetical protein
MHEDFQNKACQRLFASVISQAINDACIPPIDQETKRQAEEFDGNRQTKIAIDAIEFLFGENKIFHLYMSLLDMHADHFRSKLLDAMESERPGYFILKGVKISDAQRRAFRWNHLQYVKRQANRAEVEKNFKMVKFKGAE